MENIHIYFREVLPLSSKEKITILEEDIRKRGGLKVKILLQNNRIVKGVIFNSFNLIKIGNYFKISDKESALKQSLFDASFINLGCSNAEILHKTGLKTQIIFIPVNTIDFEDNDKKYRLYYSALDEKQIRELIYNYKKCPPLNKRFNFRETILTFLIPSLLIEKEFHERVTNKQLEVVKSSGLIFAFILLYSVNIRENPFLKLPLLGIFYINLAILLIGSNRVSNVFDFTGDWPIPLEVYKKIGWHL